MMYQSFYPAKLPPDPKIDMDEECINLLIEAHINNKQMGAEIIQFSFFESC